MKKITLILALLSAGLTTQSVAQARKTVDCYCTDKSGARVELGQTRCMNVGGRVFMARCEMSLNVPMWREQESSCLTG
ncbi:hypothetical protein [uncultured Litoreibacter sp.]|uniref:hypothetical protein n=1 Tax=uncultured Litoreibacter sp. TaxID=1392394 RepID=UPI002613D25A|nr:hypothetical protein [uncultured Litoreibacter sp.]